jgi:hypothetical protein
MQKKEEADRIKLEKDNAERIEKENYALAKQKIEEEDRLNAENEANEKKVA